MAIRRELTRQHRISDHVIAQLTESIEQGVPWVPGQGSLARGYADLIFLVKGLFYPICDFIPSIRTSAGRPTADRDSAVDLWAGLRESILVEHIRHRPGSRPWAWWNLEDREPQRVIGIDELMVPHNGGKILEDEEVYLRRHKLLSREEKRHTSAEKP
jgi:hypothetical protein